MMLPRNIEEGDVRLLLTQVLEQIHKDGPVAEDALETLSYAKELYPKIFRSYERTLMYEMGLFHKTKRPKSVLEFVYDEYKQTIIADKGKIYSPVQYSALKNIDNNQIFSFSAPTSSGKSYLFREILKEATYDVVVVLPSRALIAEYMRKIQAVVPSDTLVLQFAEDINKAKTNRRIFVLTPERAADLYAICTRLNVGLILFDEAQLIEDEHRGLYFDEMVRLCREYMPHAKLVFAHPFVDNPEAQLKRNNLQGQNSATKVYQQQGVGKIFIYYDKDQNFYYFTPYKRTSVKIPSLDVVHHAITNNKSVLIYVSKSELYSSDFLKKFDAYIRLCNIVDNEEAIQIIEKLHEYIGGSIDGAEPSLLLQLMRKGIVIHHGSMPLKARMLIEKFVNRGFARICFATSTLMQGINMPFDVVWVDNFRFQDQKKKTLDFKNLIGRAGRSTKDIDTFNYGYVVVSENHRHNVKDILKERIRLSEVSMIETPIEKVPEDYRDTVEAIKDRSYDTELRITNAQKDRLKQANSNEDVRQLLDLLFIDGALITAEEYNGLSKNKKEKVKKLFREIYTKHLRREELSEGEKSILSASIPIMLWRVQGKSFKEIIALRKGYIKWAPEYRDLKRKRREGEFSEDEYLREVAKLSAKGNRYSPVADTLPQNKYYRCVPLFETFEKFDYDKLVYDTYDYLDKVINFSISTPISAAILLYYKENPDPRAHQLYNYIRYGTDDRDEIMLSRYGFELEDMKWLKGCIDSIDGNQIVFNDNADTLDDDRKELIKRYL